MYNGVVSLKLPVEYLKPSDVLRGYIMTLKYSSHCNPFLIYPLPDGT